MGRVKPAARKYSKVGGDHELDENGEMWVKVSRDGDLKQGRKRGSGGISEVASSIRATVLYDQPPEFLRPALLEEKHKLFCRIKKDMFRSSSPPDCISYGDEHERHT